MKKEENNVAVEEIQSDLFVGDLISGGDDIDIEEVQIVKDPATHLFVQVSFRLHKWNSKVTFLEVSATAE